MDNNKTMLGVDGTLNIVPTISLPRPLVAIERASEAVRDICLSSVCIIKVFKPFRH